MAPILVYLSFSFSFNFLQDLHSLHLHSGLNVYDIENTCYLAARWCFIWLSACNQFLSMSQNKQAPIGINMSRGSDLKIPGEL